MAGILDAIAEQARIKNFLNGVGNVIDRINDLQDLTDAVGGTAPQLGVFVELAEEMDAIGAAVAANLNRSTGSNLTPVAGLALLAAILMVAAAARALE